MIFWYFSKKWRLFIEKNTFFQFYFLYLLLLQFPLGDFFDTPVPLLRRGGPYPNTQALRPYHRGEGCNWLRYSFARVLVSPAEPLPYGLAMVSYATELRLFYA